MELWTHDWQNEQLNFRWLVCWLNFNVYLTYNERWNDHPVRLVFMFVQNYDFGLSSQKFLMTEHLLDSISDTKKILGPT